MTNETELTVIIPTLNRDWPLRELLGSLERQLCKYPFEVLVVANLPDVPMRKVIESYGAKFRYLETGRVGINIARNKGLERARGSIVLFLDDDAYISDRRFLERHVELHKASPEVAAIGGRYILKAGANAIETAYHWILDYQLTLALHDKGETTRLLGGNCSFKKSLLGKQLHFNEFNIFGQSEVDLFARLAGAGFQLSLHEELGVEHRLSLSLKELMERAYRQGIAAGRRERTETTPIRKHWHQTLTIEQNMRRSKARPLAKDSGFVDPIWVYEHLFAYGRSIGREQSDARKPAPPLTLQSYIGGHFKKLGSMVWMTFIERANLKLNRALSVTRKLGS